MMSYGSLAASRIVEPNRGKDLKKPYVFEFNKPITTRHPSCLSHSRIGIDPWQVGYRMDAITLIQSRKQEKN